ncbi:DgyrCDS2151 [Dimorphilus gyrociliatus]|uniref:DgyrCDS2151 n=1 Tax=Dimorphilus gyrociliatus TaxID=2664684 RepID=A0A7I8VAP5_9ANNE|nr:DgyrCDS2151 [Dimorphilus gyrociliatus]
MKGLILLTFAFILLHGALSQFSCPTDDDFNYIDGAFIDPINCNNYYHCINGTFHLRQCPPGLHFTIAHKDCHFTMCTSPAESNCPSYNQSEENEVKFFNDFDAKASEESYETCQQNGTFANNTDCTQYFHCFSDRVYAEKCPSGFFFNPSLNTRNCDRRICVPLENAACPTGGSWSSWSSWSPCEPECGTGIRIRERSCNNPPPANGGAKCPGSSTDIEVCQSRNCTFGSSPAFFVGYRNSPFLLPGKMIWNSVVINNKDLYNPSNSEMKVEENGFYYMSLSGGSSTGNGYHSSLQGTGRLSALFRQTGSSFNGVDTFSRSGIFSLNRLFNPYAEFETFSTPIFSREDGYETSWLAFRYESRNLLFCGSSLNENNPGDIRLQEIIVLRGAAPVPNSYSYRVADSGWYYINIGTGFEARTTSDVVLTINNEPQTNFSLSRSQSNNFQNDQASRGGVVFLEANDVIGLRLLSGAIRSTNNLYTYMTAMKLNTTFFTPVLYVRRSGDFFSSSLSNVSYDDVVFNNGNIWHSSTSEYEIEYSGLYFIEVNAGSSPNTRLNLEIHVNGQRRLSLVRTSNLHNNFDTMSRSGLLNLKEKDRVQIKATDGLNSNNRRVISLTMFIVSS